MTIRSNYKRRNFSTKQEISSHKVSRLAFNFSFFTKDKDYNLNSKLITHKVKNKLLEKILSLSEEDKVIILNRSKEQGLELLPEDEVNLRVNPEFKSSGRFANCEEDYWIFRLNKLGRVVGKINKNIFYILAIDVKFDLYNHG